jgi:hypothetical protein
MPALGHEQSFATQSHVSSTFESRHLAIHLNADEKIMIAHESRERVAKLFRKRVEILFRVLIIQKIAPAPCLPFEF